MKDVKVNVYEFNELSKDVQERVIERYQDELAGFLDVQLEEIMKWELNKYTNNLDFRLNYSLSYCQGDGVSFTGSAESKEELFTLASLVYDNKIPKNILRLIKHEIIYSVEFVRGNSHYVHKYTVTPTIIDNNIGDGYCHIRRAIAAFEKKIHEWYLQTCDNLEKVGYDTIENMYHKDTIKGYIESNEFKFFIDGRDFLE